MNEYVGWAAILVTIVGAAIVLYGNQRQILTEVQWIKSTMEAFMEETRRRLERLETFMSDTRRHSKRPEDGD